MSPPKKERRLCWAALRKLRLQTVYHVVAFNAKLREKPYWFWESWRGRLADRLENERSTR
jgi:hypothetical protein